MLHTDLRDVMSGKVAVGDTVTVCGWVRTARDSKNMAFLELNDGTALTHMQIVIDKSTLTVPAGATHLGAGLKVVGTVVTNMRGDGVEINASEIVVLGDSPADYPLQKKYQRLETLREIPHLRVRTNTFNAVFRVRSVMAASIHRYFQDRGYVYVNTPLITGSDCEGAGEMFQVTTIGYSKDYESREDYYADDFFGRRAGLSVSGQLEGEVAAMAFGKIYTFGPSFRAENSNTPRHVAEFWHVEPEVAFAELPDIIAIAEEMIKYIIADVMEKCAPELDFFEARFEKGLREKLQSVLTSDFAIVDYTTAIEQLLSSGKEFEYPVAWGCDLQTEHERYITEELKILEEKIFTSDERALKLEEAIYKQLLAVLSERIGQLQEVSKNLALLDCLVSLATVAKERRYVRPTMKESGEPLQIKEGRHPVVEAISKERFVPNDALLDNAENRCAIITGPNMAGKSTYMRQIGLIALMSHIGSFVPAKSAEIPLIDRIFTRVGASDNLIFDQSTFMVEMTEVATILLHATKDSLLILDEVGRGTSTYDGLSIAWAVIEFLAQNVRAKTLFSTHYHELTELENQLEGVKNYKVTVKEFNGAVVFLRKIMRGGANRSFGIEVAALAGVPKEVTGRAKGILKALEKSDIARGKLQAEFTVEDEPQEKQLTEVEKILSEIDINTLSPMQAFLLLGDLKEKLEAEN